MILASLLVIVSLLGLLNGILAWWGHYLNINNPPLSIEMLMGYLFYPVAFLLGVERNGDLYKVAKLLGTKIVANEFVAVSPNPRSSLRLFRTSNDVHCHRLLPFSSSSLSVAEYTLLLT